jgi:two-component system, NtrC family, response regulator HydG
MVEGTRSLKPMSEEGGCILVVDDAPDTVEVLERNLTGAGYDVLTAQGVVEAVGILNSRAVDVVVTDLKMPGINGMDLVRHVRENCRESAVLVITGYPSFEGAVQAIKTGAEDFLPKPFTDEELLRAVHNALDKLRARQTIEGTSPTPPLKPGLIGDSDPIRRILRRIERSARTESPVLIIGASGTGKELVARTIHYSSCRTNESFVPADLALIPTEQAECEVFGHKVDGPSGGLFRAAMVGTLYLKHLEYAPPALQATLAQVLGNTSDGIHPRIIASSIEAPAALLKRGIFREDLFHRLSITTIEIPTLRERGDDILALTRHFAIQTATRSGRAVPRFSDQAIQVLRMYSWPGNVRELQNVVEQLVILCGSEDIDVTDLPAMMRFSVLRDRAVLRPLSEVELEHIEKVIAAVDGNRARAAEILGIDRKTLREKMKHVTPTKKKPDLE